MGLYRIIANTILTWQLTSQMVRAVWWYAQGHVNSNTGWSWDLNPGVVVQNSLVDSYLGCTLLCLVVQSLLCYEDPNWSSGNWINHQWDWTLRASHAFSAQCAEERIIKVFNQIVTPSFRKSVTSFFFAAWYLLDLMRQAFQSLEGLGFPTGWGWVFSHQDKNLRKWTIIITQRKYS